MIINTKKARAWIISAAALVTGLSILNAFIAPINPFAIHSAHADRIEKLEATDKQLEKSIKDNTEHNQRIVWLMELRAVKEDIRELEHRQRTADTADDLSDFEEAQLEKLLESRTKLQVNLEK